MRGEVPAKSNNEVTIMIEQKEIDVMKNETAFTKDIRTQAIHAALLIAGLLLEIRDVLSKNEDEIVARDKRRLEITERNLAIQERHLAIAEIRSKSALRLEAEYLAAIARSKGVEPDASDDA